MLCAIRGLKIVVLGAGPIGNLVAQTAKGLGAAEVMITDISDFRLKKAAECGIDHCVNTKSENLGEAIAKAYGADKADVIYDYAGNNVTMGQAIQYARKGSMIILVAVFASNGCKAREVGVTAFMEKERCRWACSCGGIVSLHEGVCSECGRPRRADATKGVEA